MHQCYSFRHLSHWYCFRTRDTNNSTKHHCTANHPNNWVFSNKEGGHDSNCHRNHAVTVTWLTEFKSVNTAAARYQNLAINQTKLSGMCGRLKCCLNYELDTYIDALEDFPDKAEKMKTSAGMAILMKTDVFKRLMYFAYAENRGKFYPLHVDQVWEALDMLKRGEIPHRCPRPNCRGRRRSPPRSAR